MKTIITIACVLLLCGCAVILPHRSEGTTLVLSGQGARLFAETQARLEISFFTDSPLPIRNLPPLSPAGYMIAIPHELHEATFLNISGTQGRRISFIVINGAKLSAENANKNVPIVLDKPQPWIEVEQMTNALRVKYGADIVEGSRVRWTSLPYWNATTKKFTLAKPPTVTISRVDDPTHVVKTKALDTTCYGLYWWSPRIALPDTVQMGDHLVISVIQDTGDLFGQIVAKETIVLGR